MNRRSFLSWFGLGWAVSRLPVALTAIASGLAACSKSSDSAVQPSADSKAASSDGFQTIGSLADLDKNGQILSEKSVIGPVLIIRNPTTPTAVVAVNPTCTHQGCLVAWKSERKSFACPCHNSTFTAEGAVIEGPARKALGTYIAKIEGNSVLVKKG
ncbi:Rieske (2Fe-2S) protein [Phormidesmis priestleyi ULC007]|uniref:Rieske (2Fe-2S) protein n=1 Tax=Phormidesmis priestleyi ULC007 TaxID=1920490 RepID=A0A2T1DIL1_9CYAN|nr:Rieske (2Fe-2S) protein [Phormidesmis priestleyi]PSB20312.1 Rieske (2Fe-2S) protein [Phormidesmis priestleyi ULC007]PZO50181.1 MAG: Rieske (2Fe-2S) protein [Phormidesmis priestleyi]